MSPHVSPSGHFRRRGPLEAAGAWAARLVPGGRLRDLLRGAYRSLLGRGALECRLPGGERVSIGADYRFVTWNPAEYEAFRAAATPGAVVLDVGANVGAYTLLFGQWTGPGGRVLAFEPSPEARAGLEEHVALNRLQDRVEILPLAVAATSGRGSFLSEGIHGTSRLDAGAGSPVEMVSIDDLCRSRGITPSVIKVDVEGAELEVLRGARETLAASDVHLFVELHPTLWVEMGIGRAQVEAELAAQGLRVEALTPGVDPWTLEGECVRVLRR